MTVAERLRFRVQTVIKYESMKYGRLQISARYVGDAGMPET
jgi:hypothetical protein